MFLRTKLDGFYLLTSMCSIRLKQTAFFGVVVGYHGDAAAVETGVLFHDAARNGKQGIRIGEELLEFPTTVPKRKFHIF